MLITGYGNNFATCLFVASDRKLCGEEAAVEKNAPTLGSQTDWDTPGRIHVHHAADNSNVTLSIQLRLTKDNTLRE